MERDHVLTIVAAHRETLSALNVKSLHLFGSVARNQATSESDVDFLVEFTQTGGLFQLLRVQHYLADLLGCEVDLGTSDALRDHLREPILREAIRIF
jgi:hypothetical protein